MTNRIQMLFDSLLNPALRVTNPEKIQRARLLSTILLVQTLIVAFIITLVVIADPEDIHEPTVEGAIAMVGISIAMYVANRLGHTSVAALGYFLPFVGIFIYIPFYSGENPAFLAFLLIPIIFIAIFFSIKRTTLAAIGILTLVGILLSFMNHSSSDLPYWNLRNMWYFLMLATGLILTFMRHLGNLEQIRQRELKRINAELEQKVAELERFTYTVSHELKSPVVTMQGFLGSVEKDLHNGNFEKAQKDFRRIARAAKDLNNTLADLLKLSRIGVVPNNFQAFPLAELVQEVVEGLSETIHARDITIHISPDLPGIYGDRARLREVFENLIDNATKYMGDEPSPVIDIGKRDGQETIFYVKDNGMGIEPQYQTKIFGLFDKLNPASEGTGIGLALVKRIIETHDGRIWVESEGLGKGSTFCLTIPDSRKNQARAGFI
ncbi:MAG TPA: ATP-binding protein [Anaerolineales bacterium]|nr:ATP-binding protein [Anaerolineales bacterium]